jgi:hypothetical protein
MRDLWPRLGVAAGALLLAVGLVGAAQAQERRDLYTVEGIAVDVTAEDAVTARSRALEEGQRDGLAELLRRFTPPRDQGRLPSVEGVAIERFVRSIEIDDEELSATRYLASLTVTYDSSAVRELLEGAAVAYTMESSPPIVVLAVLEARERPILWEDPNPWRDAWNTALPRDTLLNLVLPLGDLQDVTTIDGAMAIEGDATAIRRIASRYDADEALVVRAAPSERDGLLELRLVAQRLGRTPADPVEATVRAEPDEELEEVMERGVVSIARALDEAWRQRDLRRLEVSGTLSVEVPLAGLGDWVQINRSLGAVPEVVAARVERFARDRVHLRVDYAGDLVQLRDALGRRGLELMREGETWRLQPMGRGPGGATDPGTTDPSS